MKKRLFSLILAFALLLSAVPTVFAALLRGSTPLA